SGFPRRWNLHDEAGSMRVVVHDRDSSTVRGDDFLYDCKAKSGGAFLVCTSAVLRKALKDVGLQLRRNAGAGVSDFQPRRTIRCERAHLDQPSVGSIAQSIAEQIRYH